MRIHQLLRTSVQELSKSAKNVDSEAKKASELSDSVGRDTIRVDSRLAKAAAPDAALSDREARKAEIKKQVSEGSYRVDSEDLAKAVINELLI